MLSMDPTMPIRQRNLAPGIYATLVSLVGLAFLLGGCESMTPRAASERNQMAIESSIRTDQDRRMDAARHPVEFLPFTKVKPGMHTVTSNTWKP